MSSIRNDIPLFVPSFSSKGNLFLPKGNKRYVSDNYDLVDVLGIRLAESYLLSAYECFLLGIHTVRKVCGGYQPATAGF